MLDQKWRQEMAEHEFGERSVATATATANEMLSTALETARTNIRVWMEEATNPAGGQHSKNARALFATLRGEVHALARLRLRGVKFDAGDAALEGQLARAIAAIRQAREGQDNATDHDSSNATLGG